MEELKKVTGKPAKPMQGVVEVPPDTNEGCFEMLVKHILDLQTGKAKFLVRVHGKTHLVDEVVVGNVTYRAANYDVAFIG
jgi:hypothetical protein